MTAATAPPSDESLRARFKLDKSQRASLIVLGLILSQVAKYIGDGAYFVFFQMRWAAQYPKGHATYADWYITDWYDRLPVHIQNVLHTHWFATQAAPAWWTYDRHLTRGIIIGLVAAALAQSVTVGLKTRPLGKWQLAFSPVLVVAIVLPLTALGVWLLTQVVPGVKNWGTAGSIPYVGDWLAAGNWQPILLGFAVLYPAKRIIKRVGATLQEASIDNKLLRRETEKPWWRYAYLPNWMQRFRYERVRTFSKLHVPRDHGRVVGFIISATVIGSLFLFIVGILVTTVGPAAHAGH